MGKRLIISPTIPLLPARKIGLLFYFENWVVKVQLTLQWHTTFWDLKGKLFLYCWFCFLVWVRFSPTFTNNEINSKKINLYVIISCRWGQPFHLPPSIIYFACWLYFISGFSHIYLSFDPNITNLPTSIDWTHMTNQQILPSPLANRDITSTV